MGQTNLAVAAATVIAALALLAALSWKARANRQAKLFSAPNEALADGLSLLGPIPAKYVSTTTLADPLDRITAHGLGMRGNCSLVVFDSGIVIDRKGEKSIAIALSALKAVRVATATIDRVVEADGLIKIDWTRDGQGLSTFLRVIENSEKSKVIAQLNLLLLKGQTND